jgi:hypothetical protein
MIIIKQVMKYVCFAYILWYYTQYYKKLRTLSILLHFLNSIAVFINIACSNEIQRPKRGHDPCRI